MAKPQVHRSDGRRSFRLAGRHAQGRGFRQKRLPRRGGRSAIPLLHSYFLEILFL
jgi:hypothetical protein